TPSNRLSAPPITRSKTITPLASMSWTRAEGTCAPSRANQVSIAAGPVRIAFARSLDSASCTVSSPIRSTERRIKFNPTVSWRSASSCSPASRLDRITPVAIVATIATGTSAASAIAITSFVRSRSRSSGVLASTRRGVFRNLSVMILRIDARGSGVSAGSLTPILHAPADQRIHRVARRRQHDPLELAPPRDDELAVRERHPRRICRDLVLHGGVQRGARRLVGGLLCRDQHLVDLAVAVQRDVLRPDLDVRLLRVEQHVEEVVGVPGVADPAKDAH